MRDQTIKKAAPALVRKSINVGISLRPDRVAWIRQTAQAKGVSISEVVRDAIDEARKQAEREAQPA